MRDPTLSDSEATMKEIKAIIKPFMLNKVMDALHRIEGLPGVTVSDTRGFGKSRGKDAPHKIIEDLVTYVPKAKLEIVVEDGMVDEVVQAILDGAHTGNVGDGKIFVYPVEEVFKIRTGERGHAAV